MRIRVLAVLILLSLLAAAPGYAQEGTELVPIVPENVTQVRQLRMLTDVPVWDADWSPNGAQLALGTLDGVLLCQCETFDTPETLVAGINAFRVAYAPDGTTLAVGTAGQPATVQLWDLTSGAQRFAVEVSGDVSSLAFSPDGAQMAAGLSNGELIVLGTADGAEVARFEGRISVDALAFTPDGAALLFAPERATLRRQPIDGSPAVNLTSTCTYTDLRVSPDGTRLLASTYDCCVEMRDLASGEALYRSVCGQTFTVDFNADGSLFVTGAQDGTLHFLAAADGAPLATFAAHDGPVSRVAFHPDGTRLVTVGLDDTARVFGVPPEQTAAPCDGAVVEPGEPVGEILYHAQPVSGGAGSVYHVQAWCGAMTRLLDGALTPAWSPDGSRLAFQYLDPATGQLAGLWIAAADGSGLAPVPGTQPPDRAPSWSPDGASLLFESVRAGGRGIYRVDLASGDVTPVLVDAEVTYERPAWSPDGASFAYIMRRVADSGEVSRLYVTDISGENPRRVSELDQVTSAAWSPDGSQLVVAAERAPFTSDVLLVDAAAGQVRALTTGHVDHVPVWSPDGLYVAFVRGGELVLIGVEDGAEEHVIARLPEAVDSTGLSWKALDAP